MTIKILAILSNHYYKSRIKFAQSQCPWKTQEVKRETKAILMTSKHYSATWNPITHFKIPKEHLNKSLSRRTFLYSKAENLIDIHFYMATA